MKIKTIILGLIILSTRLYPCDCISPTPEIAMKSASTIFVGKLISVTIDSNLFVTTRHGVDFVRHWNFTVVKYLKGLDDDSPVVSILSGGTNCDYGFSYYPIGTEFIIYAANISDHGYYHFLTTSQCSQTKLTTIITDKYELSIYNDISLWKTPKSFNPKLKINVKVDKPEEARVSLSSFGKTNGLLIALVIFNLVLTAYLILRKK